MLELLDKIGGPEDLTTDYSNRDSNKGMVKWNFEPYPALGWEDAPSPMIINIENRTSVSPVPRPGS